MSDSGINCSVPLNLPGPWGDKQLMYLATITQFRITILFGLRLSRMLEADIGRRVEKPYCDTAIVLVWLVKGGVGIPTTEIEQD